MKGAIGLASAKFPSGTYGKLFSFLPALNKDVFMYYLSKKSNS